MPLRLPATTPLRLIAALMLTVLYPAMAAAQFDTATVLGTVTDASGSHVPGVTVTLRNVDTGISASTVTDQDGSYQFLNVRIGAYTVRAELAGFSTAVAENMKQLTGVAVRDDT